MPQDRSQPIHPSMYPKSPCNAADGICVLPPHPDPLLMTQEDWRKLGAALQRSFSEDEKVRIQRGIYKNNRPNQTR